MKQLADEQLLPQAPCKGLNPSDIVKTINEAIDPDTIVSVDAGEHKLWMSRCLVLHKPNTYLVSNGLATMGFSIPAAIAAKTLFPQRRVLCTIGDAGFAMTFGELETIKRMGLAFPILVFNNDLLGMIYMKQKQSYGGRSIGVAFSNPDFRLIAKAFRLNSATVKKKEELPEALEQAFKSDRATIIDVQVNPEAALAFASND
jgi:acetolactate synthase-1/2/3 large subunit